MSWDEDKVAILAAEWEGNNTPAEAIGVKIGMTTGAVISKANRLGLRPRTTANRYRRKLHAPRCVNYKLTGSDRSKVTAGVVEVVDPLDVVGVSPVERTDDQCAWPIGDPQSPDFGMCGALIAEGWPYCARHVERAVDKVVSAPLPPSRYTTGGRAYQREGTPDLVELFLKGEAQ